MNLLFTVNLISFNTFFKNDVAKFFECFLRHSNVYIIFLYIKSSKIHHNYHNNVRKFILSSWKILRIYINHFVRLENESTFLFFAKICIRKDKYLAPNRKKSTYKKKIKWECSFMKMHTTTLSSIPIAKVQRSQI